MGHSFRVGDTVRAASRITEEEFAGNPLHTHASVGDLGLVQVVDGEWLTVTWQPSGTTTDCNLSEVRWEHPGQTESAAPRSLAYLVGLLLIAGSHAAALVS